MFLSICKVCQSVIIGHGYIVEVPEHLRFDTLKSFFMIDLIVSSPDLTRIFDACRKLEILKLNLLVVDEEGEKTYLKRHISILLEIFLIKLNIKVNVRTP